MNLPLLIAAVLLIGILIGAAYLIATAIKSERRAKEKLKAHEAALKREAYESEMLRELGERFGYELDEAKIVDIIAGSIGKLFPYTTVASMLISEEQITFKIHLEESVSRKFIDQVKQNMFAALEALEGKTIREYSVSEQLTGTIIDDANDKLIGSFFNIPIVINEKLAGLLNISATSPGLYQEAETTILYKIVAQASTAVSKLRHVLETEKGKLSAMVESMSDGVIMVDNETRLIVLNPTAKEFLNITEPQPTIFTILDAVGQKFKLRQKIEEVIKKDSLVVIDEAIFKDRALKVFIAPVRDKKEKLIGAVVLLHDISKEKELERLREDFMAMMVHELRSPLTAVRGASTALQAHKDDFTEAKKEEYLKMIEGSAEEMLGMVNDLLDVAKIEVGKFQITPEPSDINALIRSKVEEYRSLALEKGLALDTRLPDGEKTIKIDPIRIGQVLRNLLSNAIKFAEKGKIEVILEDKEKEVIISVKDTGPGIDSQEQFRLFSKFGQLTSGMPRTAKGTGLGLVIAKGIVEAHGGSIWVQSTPGKGSTFSFSLPKGKT
ncbi:PAS domain-containing protein [Patescibacteria group bacterium]|nr:PAS domain-containing protein [Patescibacteria group bacterium]